MNCEKNTSEESLVAKRTKKLTVTIKATTEQELWYAIQSFAIEFGEKFQKGGISTQGISVGSESSTIHKIEDI